MSDPVGVLEELTKDQPHNPLRPHQFEAYQEEMERLSKIVKAPPFVGGDRGAATKRYRTIEKMLRDQAPKPITDPVTRDKVAKACDDVLNQVIRPSMQSRAVMRRNPPGAVSKVLRGESSAYVKRGSMAWKRARWGLDPTNQDRDFTNLEIYRQEDSPAGTSTFMADAQIPGAHAMTPLAKAHWPMGEPTATTAISHLEPTVEPATTTFLLCACGCGRNFEPRVKTQKFANKECRERDHKLRTMRGEKKEWADPTTEEGK